ncbi:phosphatase PAP2 family protein [Candidatus Daviesbacteria bacterium]|nr:phosphatase PAP2 family protein [Candidatus Daviesbacteria bacterium]
MELFVSKIVSLKRALGFKKLLAILFTAFATLTFFAKFNPYFSFDLLISQNIQYFRNPLLDFFMETISMLGNKSVALVSLVFISSLVYLLKKRKEAIFIFISDFGIYAAGEFIKFIVARPRPDPNLVIQMVTQTKPDSFPSGHVLHFMGFYGFLLFLIIIKFQKSTTQKILAWFLTLLIVLIGISRIYLGAHWFSDVLGSYLLGTFWLLLMTHIYYKIS